MENTKQKIENQILEMNELNEQDTEMVNGGEIICEEICEGFEIRGSERE